MNDWVYLVEIINMITMGRRKMRLAVANSMVVEMFLGVFGVCGLLTKSVICMLFLVFYI